jgi:hypothetical protein
MNEFDGAYTTAVQQGLRAVGDTKWEDLDVLSRTVTEAHERGDEVNMYCLTCNRLFLIPLHVPDDRRKCFDGHGDLEWIGS